MKSITDDESVKFINLKESFAQEDSKTNFIDDNFYENKKPSIFDDDFQGIEWPIKDDLTRFCTSLDITDLRNLLNPSNPLHNTSMFDDD